MSFMTALGSLPGSSRQSTSAYAVSEITLVFWLADSTVGVIVSRTRAFWTGIVEELFQIRGILQRGGEIELLRRAVIELAIVW